ncbi:D-2-hydroxyacid dehydrogenase [Halomarina rubra]|uniref:D-2-hydroxyacid dehydrogenase n=1 Tax=Halomarina rubra TaxID=2071873 RepID=A0ABD6AZ51_9EURY|nr:D-2-hydroxyacid dehydrogenase [Halomarina rubra]
MTDLLVLRRGVHGIPVEEYAAALRDRLPDHDVELARTPAEERAAIADAPVVTGVDVSESLLDRATDLRLFAGMYAGYGHLPMDELRDRDVAVTTASGVHGPNVAEHALASILAFVQSFPTAFERQRNREWRHFQTHELAGATVTVVGLGAIGRGVVERLQGFDVETVGVRRSPDAGGPADEVVGPDRLDDVLARTDYLVLACPLTDETRGLVDESSFRTLPPEAVLVNVARGPVVDTDALVAALRSGEIRGAALDVTDPEPLPEDHPLWGLSNVIVTPHNSGHTPRYYERLADIVAENVRRVDETGRYEDLRNQVA